MEGHVERRGSRWVPVLELPPDPETGERRRTSMGGHATQREAREALRNAQEQARRGWQGPDRLTLAAYLADWLEGVDLSRAASTAALYRTLMEHHVNPRLGGERLQRLTPAALTRLYGDLLRSGGPGGRPLSARSVRNVATTLHRALADAVEARLLDYNPGQAAKVPRIDRHRELEVWTAAQVGAFLEATADDRLAPLWITAATSGMRRSELLALRWGDLTLNATPPRLQVRRALVQYGKVITEKEPKTATSRRTIALDPAAAAALRHHRVTQAQEKLAAGAVYTDDGRVFCDEIGRALRPGVVSSTFQRHVKAAGLPKLGLHGLRHSWATLGLEAGVDTVYLARILGHSSPTITASIYQHARADRLDEAVQQVGDTIFQRAAR